MQQSVPCIGIDCRFGGTNGGLGTFTRGLVRALLQKSDPWKYELFVLSLSEPWLLDLPPGRASLTEAPFPHYSFQEQALFPNLLQDAKCDLFYSPHFTVPLFCPVPFVCTVHDLILHRFPNEAPLPKRLGYRLITAAAVRRARKIVVVSTATQEELEHLYGKRVGRKSILAYPGIEPLFRPPSDDAKQKVQEQYSLHSPYLLYVGNCKEHKNVSMLLAAFRKAGLGGVELVLVAGGRECGLLPKVPGVRFLSDVPLRDLPALYGSALATVTATLAEGFCLPLIEAMACGCPVLATNVGPIPEVTGGHALLTEPTIQALTQGMRQIVSDKTMRSPERLESAEEWVEKFSWEIAAENVSGIFTEALGVRG